MFIYRYGSDASLAAVQGFDANFACVGLGVDATHHYERTHNKFYSTIVDKKIKKIIETVKFLYNKISF